MLAMPDPESAVNLIASLVPETIIAMPAHTNAEQATCSSSISSSKNLVNFNGPLAELPAEIICEILQYLKPHDVICLSMVCKQLNVIVESLCVSRTAEMVLRSANSRASGRNRTAAGEASRAKRQYNLSRGRPEHVLMIHGSEVTRRTIFSFGNENIFICSKTDTVAASARQESDLEPVIISLYVLYSAMSSDPDGTPLAALNPKCFRFISVIVALGYEDDIVVLSLEPNNGIPRLTSDVEGTRLVGYDLQTKRVLWVRGNNPSFRASRTNSFLIQTSIHNNLFTYVYPINPFPLYNPDLDPIFIIHAVTGQIISENHHMSPSLFAGQTIKLVEHLVSPDGNFYILVAEPWNYDSTQMHKILLLVGDTLTGNTVASFVSETELWNTENSRNLPIRRQVNILAIDGIDLGSEAVPQAILSDSVIGQRSIPSYDSDLEALRPIAGTRESLVEQRRLHLDKNRLNLVEYTAFVNLYEFYCDSDVIQRNSGNTKTFLLTFKIEPSLTTNLTATVRQIEERAYFIPRVTCGPDQHAFSFSSFLGIGPSLQLALHYDNTRPHRQRLEIMTFREMEMNTADMPHASGSQPSGGADGKGRDPYFWLDHVSKVEGVKRFRMEVENRYIISLPLEIVGRDCGDDGGDSDESQLNYSMPSAFREEEGEAVLRGGVLFF